MARNMLFITVDQWRGDSLSSRHHPVVETPALDALAAAGVLFANHWANAAPCGPSRACLYTGTYLHQNRSLHNGTPLDARFTNVALLARQAGYRPVLFGYTDTSPDPRTLPADDPRLFSYEGVLPGFEPVLVDSWESGSPGWGRWLAAQGVDVPANPHDLYQPVDGFPGADRHGVTWAPTRFTAAQSETAFVVEHLLAWLEAQGDQPFFVHASFIRPHPPYRNPRGYHDRYSAEAVGPFVAAPTRDEEAAIHPLAALAVHLPGLSAHDDERDRRQLRATYHGAQREVDDQLGRVFDHLRHTGRWDDTLVVVTSDHGEMGGDHWLLEKLGYWDESYHVPCIVRDPDRAADPTRGQVVTSFTESVDILPTLCDAMGVDTPAQADGWSLAPFLQTGSEPSHWRQAAHFEWCLPRPLFGRRGPLGDLPAAHGVLAVERGAHEKYVQFAAAPERFPPLLFDLADDPWQLHDLSRSPGSADRGWAAAQRLLRWRMRSEERQLSSHFLHPRRGLVVHRDEWW